jgi:hypothetical protein
MHLCEASGNDSPPTPNSAQLHRTEMINNVVQDIDENMKVFINKMFDRREKEINTLKCKVDKLNKDCVVLMKNNDQLHVLSNGLRDVLKKYVTKEKKAIEENMLWRSVADIVLKLMCVSCCYIYSQQIFHRNKE